MRGKFTQMIDLHCHFLPGVDDGAQTLEEALGLARAAVADGVRHAVMTPHVHPSLYSNMRSNLEPALHALRRALGQHGIELEISLGGEMRLEPASLELILRGEVPSVGHWGAEPVVLVELPHDQIPMGSDKAVAFLRRQGVVPMIAHPERNKGVLRDWKRIEPFVDAGCLLQVTAGSVCGDFGEKCRVVADQLLEKNWVTVVASDAHNLTHRPPAMSRAHAALVASHGLGKADQLTRHNPALIVLPTHPLGR